MTQLGERTAKTEALEALARSSVALILDLQDASGAYPASPTFSAYTGYSWFRDGSFIADAMSAAGESESAELFFDWCARVLDARGDAVRRIVAAQAAGTPLPDSEMLGTRFTFDGADGDVDWWDFQLDGYGTWLWALATHAARSGRSLKRWLPALELTVDYLLSSWRRPCFDWWEEHEENVHLSTLGCILAGFTGVIAAEVLDGARRTAVLSAIADISQLIASEGTVDGRLSKWLGSVEVDASLVALVSPLNVIDGTTASRTVAAVDEVLNENGGVHRYLADTFYGGGQWPLLSCMLGLAFCSLGEPDRAFEQLEWAARTATSSGEIPEQVPDHLLAPGFRDEWIERWGPVACPLVWSHAMFVRLAVELSVFEGRAA